MGCGKSTFGKKLANALNYNFIDTDIEIENLAKKTVYELFNSNGEQYFRSLEEHWLKEFNGQKNVISTGGGLPCFNDNMEILNQKGITIYLRRPVKELVNRLINSKKSRPLIVNMSAFELEKYIEHKLAERESFYNLALMKLNRNNQNVNSVIKFLESI